MTDPSPLSWPQTSADLLARVAGGWTALADLITPLDVAALTTPGAAGGWTVKDHLAHLHAWERKLLAVLRGQPAYVGLAMDATTYTAANLDAINALLDARYKSWSFTDLWTAAQQTHTDLIAALDTLQDSDLHGPYPSDDPSDPTPRHLVQGIVDNTYGHYAEHCGWIQELLATQPPR